MSELCTSRAGMYAQQRVAAVQLALTSKGCTTVSVTAAGASACAHTCCSYSCGPASITCHADPCKPYRNIKPSYALQQWGLCDVPVTALSTQPPKAEQYSGSVLKEELLYAASSTRAYPCWSIQGLASTALRLQFSSQPDLYSDCARPAAEHVQCCLVTNVSLQGRYRDSYMSWPPTIATCDSNPCSLSSKPRQCCSLQAYSILQLP